MRSPDPFVCADRLTLATAAETLFGTPARVHALMAGPPVNPNAAMDPAALQSVNDLFALIHEFRRMVFDSLRYTGRVR